MVTNSISLIKFIIRVHHSNYFEMRIMVDSLIPLYWEILIIKIITPIELKIIN